MPGAVRDSFLRYGATRNSFYCPANPDQNVDGAWNYAGGAFSVAGYAFGYNGTISLSATNWNVLTIPQTIPFGPATYPPPSASKRVLLADVVMSTYGQNDSAQRNSYQYSGIVGGLGTTFSHRTSHLNNKFPAGGNVAMLDAHVEWRPFPLMLPRTDRTDMPCFWW
jgi:prepilin-type processing-associated H-X9-DG protein